MAQTLADYAQLIPAVKTKLELQQNTTVVVIGGSYGVSAGIYLISPSQFCIGIWRAFIFYLFVNFF